MAKPINRRGTFRRTPRGKHKVECRLGVTGLGRNIAERLIDISQTGASLIVSRPVDPEAEVELTLNCLGRPRPVRVAAMVVRCTAGEDGKHTLCVHFERPLDYASWQQLT